MFSIVINTTKQLQPVTQITNQLIDTRSILHDNFINLIYSSFYIFSIFLTTLNEGIKKKKKDIKNPFKLKEAQTLK